MLSIRQKKLIQHLVIATTEYNCNIMHVLDIDIVHDEYEGSLYETIFFILNGYTLPIEKLSNLEEMEEIRQDYDNLLNECIEILNNFFENSIDKLE